MLISLYFRNFAATMPFPFHIDILDLALKGVLIGIFASAPMGPVGVLCVQRTLNKGRWYGFVTGVGACVSDIIYALIAGLGMSFIMDLITQPHTRFVLQLFGSVMLMLFGLYCFKSNPTKKMHVSGNKKGTLIHNGVTAFLVTFSNPLILFLFVACFAQFAFVMPGHPLETGMGFLGIVLGALLWWFGLTWLIDKIRGRFTNDGILLINKIIGGVVVFFSILMLIGTLFNIYTFQY